MTTTPGTAQDHQKWLDQFEEAYEQSSQERELAERDRDYYDGKQLSEEELATLKARKQPPVISNRIAPKVDALLGHEKRMRTDPRAYPRTPKHEAEADSVTDAIRFVCDSNRFSAIRSAATENLLIEGIAAATVTIRNPDKKPEVRITHVPWDRFYRDPHSRKRDFSDAAYLGVVLWMDESEALAKFPGKEDVLKGCYSGSGTAGETFDDRPTVTWSDVKRKRVRVLQHRMLIDGVWNTAILCKGGFLREPQVSPYVDEEGTPLCDLIATSAYIDRENQRYGVVRRMISPQDEINKRRSKALHLLNSRQIVAEKGAVDDVAQAKREAAKPDGYIEIINGFRFDFNEAPGLVAGQFQLLQEAKAEIDASGVNPAIEGDASGPSGRAQEMMLQSGLAEMAGVFEGVRDWSWEIYRHVWFRIRQFWTEERWIRVTDDERNLRWVAINKRVTVGEHLQQQGQAIDPTDPRMQMVARIENAVGELDVDLILEDGPDSITIQSEQYDQLVELKKADPGAIPTRAIIEASSLRNKDKLLEQMDQGGVPPQMQQQMQAMQQQLAECQKALEQARQANDLKGAELQLKRYEAVTSRVAALKAIPPDIPDGWNLDGSTPNVPDMTAPQWAVPVSGV